MRNLFRFPVSGLLFVAVSVFLMGGGAAAFGGRQNTTTAGERGYRTGYTDGYQAGFTDTNSGAGRNFRDNAEYKSADRSYQQGFGSIDEYRGAYRRGFESGYGSAFDHRPFDSTIPTDITSRQSGGNAQTVPAQQIPDNPSPSGNTNQTNQSGQTGQSVPDSSLPNDIKQGTALKIELLGDVSTDLSQRGDPFQARVLEPSEYQGAILKGHVAMVKRPGRVKGSGELQLAFDQIILNGHPPAPFDAIVTEVIENGVRDTSGKVDSEGGVKGRDDTKDDVTKIGAATGVGAVIGAIAGGGKGAAIGAIIGGGASTGGVLVTRGKDLRLHAGQQLRIQTSHETRF